VMATHLVNRGRSFCDGGLLLDQGRLTYSGTAAQLPASADEAA
jgi:ABC-type multidrug transport system ATPase subunit